MEPSELNRYNQLVKQLKQVDKEQKTRVINLETWLFIRDEIVKEMRGLRNGTF